MDKFFTEDDKAKFINFLNMVAKHGRFDLSTPELIEYFKLLSHMQKVMIPKLDANILEILKVVEPKEPVQEVKE